MHRLGLGEWQDLAAELDTLVVATFHNPPFTVVDPARPGHVTGFLADLMGVLAERVGVSLVYDTNNTAGDFGVRRPDGSFTGLVGRLVNKTAHVGLAPLSWRDARQRVIDYVGKVPIATEKINFLVPSRPRANMNDVGALLTPFDSNVWICLLCGMLLATVLLRATVTLTQPRDPRDDTTFSIVSSLVHVYACIVQQGWSTTPNRSSSRLVMLTARVLGILIYVEYTAMLISVMTVTKTTTAVGSVDEFVARGDWSLLVQKGVAYTSDWKTSKEASLRTLYERIQTGRGVKVLTPNNMAQMLDDRVVTLFDLQQAFIMLGASACRLVTLPVQWRSGRTHVSPTAGAMEMPAFLIMQKHMKLKPKIDRVMQSLYQTGTIDSLYQRWFWNATNQSCAGSGGFRSLAFDEVMAVIFVIPAGVILSLVVLGLERLAAYCVRNTELRFERRLEARNSAPIEHRLWRM